MPTSGVDSRIVWCGGVHRKQPRAGAGRAISLGDGISNGCVDVYVRCWIFLLKRSPVDVMREGDVIDCTGVIRCPVVVD